MENICVLMKNEGSCPSGSTKNPYKCNVYKGLCFLGVVSGVVWSISYHGFIPFHL